MKVDVGFQQEPVLNWNSLSNRRVRCPNECYFHNIFKESLALLALNSLGRYLTKWRIPGVLQRFGVSYFVVATVNLLMSPSEEKQDVSSILLRFLHWLSLYFLLFHG